MIIKTTSRRLFTHVKCDWHQWSIVINKSFDRMYSMLYHSLRLNFSKDATVSDAIPNFYNNPDPNV